LSTLYIRHPSKASTDSVQVDESLTCAFALVSDSGAIERQSVGALATLSDLIGQAQRVVVLLAASDVSLLRVKVPPLSLVRLKVALPNLVEEQLVSDPAECVLVAAHDIHAEDGLRSVAVVQRGWLTQVAQSLQALGARHIIALPSQLCLPYQAGMVSAAVSEPATEHDPGIDLSVRLSQQEGIGVPVLPEHGDFAAQDVLQVLRAIVPQAAVSLYVPQPQLQQYQNLAGPGIEVAADSWQRWIAGARGTSLDLMTGLSAAAGGGTQGFNWQRWRWPVTLAVLTALVHIGSLNYEWWRTKREADSLRTSMLQSFHSAYPKELAIVDPAAQMKQKIAAAKIAAGQTAPGDFAALAAAFGEAWTNVTQNRPGPGIANLDYKERSLQVHLKANPEGLLPDMKAALAARNLVLTATAADVWQIRSAK
jgi:general secretion pathway protein L